MIYALTTAALMAAAILVLFIAGVVRSLHRRYCRCMRFRRPPFTPPTL